MGIQSFLTWPLLPVRNIAHFHCYLLSFVYHSLILVVSYFEKEHFCCWRMGKGLSQPKDSDLRRPQELSSEYKCTFNLPHHSSFKYTWPQLLSKGLCTNKLNNRQLGCNIYSPNLQHFQTEGCVETSKFLFMENTVQYWCMRQ